MTSQDKGSGQPTAKASKGGVGNKSFLTTAILSVLVGYFGVDRFYVGKIGTGILKLLTFGGLGIWYVVDIILIYTGSFRDKQSNLLAGRNKKNLLIAIGVLVVLLLIGIVTPKSSDSNINSATNAPQTTGTWAGPKADQTPAKTTQVERSTTTSTPSSTSQKTATPAVPAEYTSALNQATTYANSMHMSQQGVYDQLVSQYGGQFSADATQYAIDHVKADWDANALATAQNYQTEQSLSPSAIHDQLVSQYGDKFTEAQADYAIQHLND